MTSSEIESLVFNLTQDEIIEIYNSVFRNSKIYYNGRNFLNSNFLNRPYDLVCYIKNGNYNLDHKYVMLDPDRLISSNYITTLVPYDYIYQILLVYQDGYLCEESNCIIEKILKQHDN